MTTGEQFFFLVIAVFLAYLVGRMGRKRKIGFGWAFFLSLISLPIGFLITLFSKKKKNDVDFIDMD